MRDDADDERRDGDEEEERCAVRSACGGATTRSFGQRQRIVTNGSRDGVQHCTTIGRSERDGWHTTPASGTARPLQRPEKKQRKEWMERTDGRSSFESRGEKEEKER
jgi:hypothetical protein